MASSELWDVAIVGAGPAGSTAAALLAERGQRVLVLDREAFPRFHIGESLLPAATGVLHRLAIEPTEDAFLYKAGARFVDEAGGREAAFEFADAFPGTPRFAWQVDRAAFDARLRDAAEARGARFQHGAAVRGVEFTNGEVRVHAPGQRCRARFLIDASGQGRLLARQHRSIVPYRQFGRAAAFTHYGDLQPAALAELGPGNDIRVIVLEGGWLWAIPLPGSRLSVGYVSRQAGIRDQDVLDRVAASPLLSRLTAGSRPGQPQLTGSFSFHNTRPRGARFVCLGDAACFIDPVFSSGVSLAMASAEQLVEVLAPALAGGAEGDPELLAGHCEQMDRAYQVFAALVHRFYNTRFVDQIIFKGQSFRGMRQAITSVFAGDLRPDNSFVNKLLSSRQRPRSQPRRAAP